MNREEDSNLDLGLSFDDYRSIVDNANDGIIVVQNGLVSFANKKMEFLLGFSAKDAIGQPFLNYIHPISLSLIENRYKMRMAGSYVPPIYEAALKHIDGSPVQVEVNARLISYKNTPALPDVFVRKLLHAGAGCSDASPGDGEQAPYDFLQSFRNSRPTS